MNHARIRPIEITDNAAVAAIIRSVMPEFGADGPGFAIHDAEVNDMFSAYTRLRCAYFVVEEDGLVKGGAGIGPLTEGDADTCELKKMYFLPELRGRGLGRELIARCLSEARELGFRRCYLETLTGMEAAQRMYQKNGFVRIPQAMGRTGHYGCNRFYLKEL